MPVTWWVGEKWWLHANVGADSARSGAHTRRVGASLEWAASDALTLIAERVKISGDWTARIGTRFTLSDTISLDLSAARVTPRGARVYVIGLNQDFTR